MVCSDSKKQFALLPGIRESTGVEEPGETELKGVITCAVIPRSSAEAARRTAKKAL